MTKALVTNELIEHAAEQIRAIEVERNFNAFQEIAQKNHSIGETIDSLVQRGMDKGLLIKRLVDLGAAKETTLYVSHQFYSRWPVIEDMYTELKIEKALSWNYVRKQLQAPKEKEEKGLCAHECDNHQKLVLPRASIGGGKI